MLNDIVKIMALAIGFFIFFSLIVFSIFLVFLLILAWPLLVIWALNTLFSLGIVYSVWSWLAVLILTWYLAYFFAGIKN